MSTNPVPKLGDNTREGRPVDNSLRYWLGRTGVVHRTVRWSPCTRRPNFGRAYLASMPDGHRCSSCFPRAEVVRGKTRTGWPRDFHPVPSWATTTG